MKEYIEKCLAGENLSSDEAAMALERIMTDQATDAQIAGRRSGERHSGGGRSGGGREV